MCAPADSTAWTHLPMTADSNGVFAFRLFDIGSKTQYSVEANGIRSNTYTLDVSNLPFVKQIDLQYRYPAYTQLPPNDVDSTGDIAALKGTLVRVRVAPTVPTTGGRIVVEGGDTLKLVPTEDGKLMAMLRVNQPGFYKVELQGPDGRMVTGSLNYTIDVLPDRPPTVQFTKPGRDSKVLSVDEVYTEVRAQDDYGVAKVDLHLLGERRARSGDVAARRHEGDQGHLGGLHVHARGSQARAWRRRLVLRARHRQQRGDRRAGRVDRHLLHAGSALRKRLPPAAGRRRWRRRRRPAERRRTSSRRHSARSSPRRSRRRATACRPTRNRSTRTSRRCVSRSSGSANKRASWRAVSSSAASRRATAIGARSREILPKAAAEMDTAEKNLTKGAPTSALQPEQRALAQLQRAEAVFHDIQVSMGGGGGGGGGGGNKTDAQDLADIFELQKDKLRNQYETVQRGQQQQQQQQSDNQVDETAEKLRQLAAREQQENERARAKADSLSRMGQSGASGGQGQRDLAQQTEDEAHKLERLAREQQNQSLADAARRLQDAADAMRRAAANGKPRVG